MIRKAPVGVRLRPPRQARDEHSVDRGGAVHCRIPAAWALLAKSSGTMRVTATQCDSARLRHPVDIVCKSNFPREEGLLGLGIGPRKLHFPMDEAADPPNLGQSHAEDLIFSDNQRSVRPGPVPYHDSAHRWPQGAFEPPRGDLEVWPPSVCRPSRQLCRWPPASARGPPASLALQLGCRNIALNRSTKIGCWEVCLGMRGWVWPWAGGGATEQDIRT